MTIIAIILLIISGWMFYHKRKGDRQEYATWKKAWDVFTGAALRYYLVGTPAKVTIIGIRAVVTIYELGAFSIPVIAAGVRTYQGGEFWEVFFECQIDGISKWLTGSAIGLIALIVIIYLLKSKFETKAEKKILANTEETNEALKRLENSIGQILENQQKQMAQATGMSNSSTIRTLLQSYGTDIHDLKIASAYKHLDALAQALKNESNNDVQLLATVQCSLGICARYIIDKSSEKHYDEAYRLIKSQVITDTLLYAQILEGKIYVACKAHNSEDAHIYVNELRTINADAYWVYVPKLIDAEDLNATYEAIPERVQKFMALTNAIMMGCKAQEYQFGIDIETYDYKGLTELTYDNFPVWIFDMSIAATKFVRQLSLRQDAKSLWNKEAEDLYNLTHSYLSLLKETEMSNLLPDTVFLENLTGYIKDQDENRLAAMAKETGRARFKELYYLGYAMMLMDKDKYPEALQLLKGYGDDASSSILNMRLSIAFRTQDISEIVEVIKEVTSKKMDIPEHLLPNYMQAFQLLFKDLEPYAKDVVTRDEHSQFVFEQFIAFLQGKQVDTERLQAEEKDIYPLQYPFLAMLYKGPLGLDKAIEVLKKCVDTKVLDMRVYKLLEFYGEDLQYGVELYHLLRELRLNGVSTIELLHDELSRAEYIQDFAAANEITQEMMKIQPDNPNILVHRIQALWKIGDYEAVRGYKATLEGLRIKNISHIKAIAKIYESLHEEAFAVEWVYCGYEFTKNQELKDFMFTLSLNPRIGNVICETHEVARVGDVVEIGKGETKKRIEIVAGSTYEVWVGKRVGDTVTMRQGEMKTETITAIHNKYFKIYIEEHQDVNENKSKHIKGLSADEVIKAKDPMALLQKLSGVPTDFANRQAANRMAYARGKMSLIALLQGADNVAALLNLLYDPRFIAINNTWEDLEQWTIEDGESIVLDLSSVIRLSDLSRKGKLEEKQKFLLPMSVKMELINTLIKEDCRAAAFVSQHVWDAVTVPEMDVMQTPLWKVTKAMLEWVEAHCEVQIVEEKLTAPIDEKSDELLVVETDSILLAIVKGILVTEDMGIRNTCKTISVGQFVRVNEENR